MITLNQRKRHKSKLELTPLVDIIFILLLFFAVSTTLITQKQGINVALPDAKTVIENDEGIVISISKDTFIYWEKQRIQMSRISHEVKNEINKNPNLSIILNADKDTPYHIIMETMDNMRIGGCYNIVLQAIKETP
jgi:biopolymer transport protein ExbD